MMFNSANQQTHERNKKKRKNQTALKPTKKRANKFAEVINASH
jgi:hypothetical protein